MKLHLLCKFFPSFSLFNIPFLGLTILLLSLSTSMAQHGGSQNSGSPSGNSDSRYGDYDDRRGGSFFGSLLFTLFIIGTFGFIASIVYYRYQVNKYRVVPFVPPSFCPKAIYPPVQETHQGTDYAYGEMELGGGDYKAPKANPLIEC